MTTLSSEVLQKARGLRDGGMSWSQLSKETGVPKSTLQRALKEEPVEVEEGFLDTESRFLSLLKSYRVSDPERIVNYLSTMGTDIYASPQALKRGLTEQGVPGGKALPIVRHWGQIEQLPIPQEMTAEGPRRYSIIGGQPVADPDGELTWPQSLQLLELQGQRRPQGDEETKALREQIADLSRRLDEMREQRLRDEINAYRGEVGRLGERIEDLSQELRENRITTGSTGADILRDGIREISNKLPDKRDVREMMQTAFERRRPVQLRGRGAEGRERELEEMAGSLEAEAELRDIEDVWFFGEGRTPGRHEAIRTERPPAPPAPPPPYQRYE